MTPTRLSCGGWKHIETLYTPLLAKFSHIDMWIKTMESSSTKWDSIRRNQQQIWEGQGFVAPSLHSMADLWTWSNTRVSYCPFKPGKIVWHLPSWHGERVRTHSQTSHILSSIIIIILIGLTYESRSWTKWINNKLERSKTNYPHPQWPWATFKHNLVQGFHIPSSRVKFYEAY